MSIYTIWIPGERGYKEHCDRMKIANNTLGAIKEQTEQLKNSSHQNSNTFNDETKQLIASNEQIVLALNDGFNRIAEINERGFSRVTSAIEDLHSDMNFFLGVIIQKLEYQNSLLNGILSVLEEPFETKVKEFYRKGSLFVKQGFLDGAIDCFKESISLKMGEYFFPSHYQLGRIYLTGIDEGINVIDPKSATFFLLKANEFGKRIAKADPSFNPILADCKFFLSQSYYYQLTGSQNKFELELLANAINYCDEALSLNPNLSQANYHAAKYISYAIHKFNDEVNEDDYSALLKAFANAVKMDRNYLRSVIKDDPFYDAVFEPNKKHIMELIREMTNEKRIIAESKLNKAQDLIIKLEELGISSSIETEFKNIKKQVELGASDFRTKTYFGYDDCEIKLKGLL